MFFRKSDAANMRLAWELSAGLLSFVIAIGIGWWFGQWLDRRFGMAPWGTIVFAALGLVAGGLNVYRALSQAMAPRDAGK